MAGKDIFNVVYSAFYRKSFLYVKSYVHDDMVAEDIATESLIKVWNKLKQDENTPVAPFLFTILKNSSLDYLKHEKLKLAALKNIKEYINRDIEIRFSTLEASDPTDIFSAEVARIIQDTLATLPERTRQVFEMSRFEGKPYKEIAEKFNISIKGIDYHIYKALSQLRTALKDYLPVWFLLLHNNL